MLGTSRSGGGNITYLKIFDGRIVREWSKKPDGIEVLERVNKMDKTVYYVAYDYVSGKLVDVDVATSDYGETVRLHLVDGTERYCLDIPASSRYGTSFFQRMLAIDLDMELQIRPYSFTDEQGKSRTGLSLVQKNEKIGYHYRMEDIPPLVEKTRGGKKSFDDTDRYNFFMEELKKFQEKIKSVPSLFTEAALAAPEQDDEEYDDDLPF